MATILVTGANRGIGYAIVQAIGNRLPDSTLLLGCRTLKAGEDAIEQLKSSGVSANLHALALDIEDDSSIVAAADVVRERFGHLDGKLKHQTSW
jgi:NAD(P)-dependent dehydrogenase (short-subunit alcohol dehydrogenase family)